MSDGLVASDWLQVGESEVGEEREIRLSDTRDVAWLAGITVERGTRVLRVVL